MDKHVQHNLRAARQSLSETTSDWNTIASNPWPFDHFVIASFP
jgi:hypothetical protein